MRSFWLLLFLGLISFACSTDQAADPSQESDLILEPAESASREPDEADVGFTAAQIEALELAVAEAELVADLAAEAVDGAEDAARTARRAAESLRADAREGAAAASDTLQEASATARIATDQRTAAARTEAANAAQSAADASDELNTVRTALLEANDVELEAVLAENASSRELRDAEFALEMAEDALEAAEDSNARAEDPLVGPADWPTWMSQPESPITTVTVDLPRVPVVALPDLSRPTELSTQIEVGLRSLLSPSSGVDVLTARCVATGGPFRYATDGEAADLLDAAQRGSSLVSLVGGGRDFVAAVSADGSGSFVDFTGSAFVQASRNADGSGAYQDFTNDRFIRLFSDGDGFGTLIDRSGDNNFELSLYPDGSSWLADTGGSTFVAILARSDGSAIYQDLTDSLSFVVEVNADGSWSFRDLSNFGDEELVVNADGTGVYKDRPGGQEITIAIGNAGAVRYRNQTDERDVEVVLFADGSWTLGDESDQWDRQLAVAADGSGWFADAGESGRLSADDTAPLAALLGPLLDAAQAGTLIHPDLLIAAPASEVAIAERFPPIGTLPQLAPPCATILRLDSALLFNVDSDVLRPGAEPIIDEVAAALRSSERAIEVHGHTDAMGSDADNLVLSERQAEVVVEELIQRGVTTEISAVGFGETEPAAPNERADGANDPAGQRLNRRVEIVLFEAG